MSTPRPLTDEEIAEMGDHASTRDFDAWRAEDRARHISEMCDEQWYQVDGVPRLAQKIADIGASAYDATEQRDAVRAVLRDGREDQSQPAPWWPVLVMIALTLGVPMLAFWIGRWTS